MCHHAWPALFLIVSQVTVVSINRTQAFPVYQGKILHDGIFFPFFHQVDIEMTIIKLPKDYELIKLMIVLPKDYESIKLKIVLSFSPWYHEAFL